MHNLNLARGVTLIELIIALVAAGILAALAAPAMTQFIQNQRIAGQVNDFVGDLNFARSEAIKRAVNVGVCTADPINPSAGCDSSRAWRDGRIVFVDSDNGGDWDAGEAVLRVKEVFDGSTNVLNSLGSTSRLIIFTSKGAATIGSATYAICDSRGTAQGRLIIVNSVGQVRHQTPASSCS